MLRSRHWFGYGSLLAITLTLACLWWSDHKSATTRAAVTDAQVQGLTAELRDSGAAIQRLTTQSAIADDQIDHLLAELRKGGANIERMAGGGFRRTYGQVPANYLVAQPLETPVSTARPLPAARPPADDLRPV